MRTTPALAISTLLVLAPSVFAVNVTREELNIAPTACQPALPIYAESLRTRPVAIQNEGTSTAFVTCGLRGVKGNVRSATRVGIYLRNNTSAAKTVNCTLVDAGTNMNNPAQQVRSFPLTANQVPTLYEWTAATHNGGQAYRYPAFSCMLPPGTGVSGVTRTFAEDVGQ